MTTQQGAVWPQDFHPRVWFGRFTGWVYLGDDSGGAGERFQIQAEAPDGSRSQPVMVDRVQ